MTTPPGPDPRPEPLPTAEPERVGAPAPQGADFGLAEPGPRRRTPRQWLAHFWRRSLHNLPLKIAALVVAVGVWFIATGDRRATTERSFDVPLTVVDNNASGQKRGVSGLPANIQVTLSGPRTRLQAITAPEVLATVNTTRVPEGNFQQAVQIRPPEGSSVARYQPTSVSGFVDAETTRTLPVQLATTQPPENAVPSYRLTPESVRVRGPQRSVETVSQVITVPVTLAQGARSEARLIALNERGRAVTDVRIDPVTVTVVRTDAGAQIVKTIPVRLPAAPAGLRIASAALAPSRVRVVGTPAQLAPLSGVVAVVPIRAGKYSARATLQLPEGVQSVESVTATLDVRRN